jgi:hypothetical protein
MRNDTKEHWHAHEPELLVGVRLGMERRTRMLLAWFSESHSTNCGADAFFG